MTLDGRHSFGLPGAYEEERNRPEREASSLSFCSGGNMFSQDYFATFDQECYALPSNTLPYNTFTLDAPCPVTGSVPRAFPPNQQPFAGLQPQQFTSEFTSNLYLPRRSSVLDTRLHMLPTDYDSRTNTRSQDYLSCASYPGMNGSVQISSSVSQPLLLPRMAYAEPSLYPPAQDMYYAPTIPHREIPKFEELDYEQSTTSVSDGISDDEEGVYDKPYAQLIYEALLAAPGHRMLLREIYDWFLRNTRKPKESGTNGWQNSIRHNLSMNQAFENDKTDPASSRGARKANSVWVLTDDAIKNGVQSTTRYRKNGNTKKGSSNRTPAIQRQKSGARGGRAARRAARLKRHEEGRRRARAIASVSQSPVVNTYDKSRLSTPFDDWSTYSQSPATPAEDLAMGSCYSLPPRSYYHHDHDTVKYEPESHLTEDETLREMFAQNTSDGLFEDIARLQRSEED